MAKPHKPKMRPRATTQQERALVAQLVAANPALASQPTEVCRLAGIDPSRKGTVCTWIKGLNLDPEQVQQARIEGAVKVQQAAADRLAAMAERLYQLADKAISKVDAAVNDRQQGGEPHDRDGAAWLRSLVGVMAQAIDKAQLLSGKPTERSEVVNPDDARRRLASRLDELAARRAAKQAAGGA
ncbi:MAG: hypothetical protein ACM3ZA_01070 [Bacillota bacterium]